MKSFFKKLDVNDDGSINLSYEYIPSFLLEKCPIYGITKQGRFEQFAESLRQEINSSLSKWFKGYGGMEHFSMKDYRILLDICIEKCDNEPIIISLDEQAPMMERLISNAVRNTLERFYRKD